MDLRTARAESLVAIARVASVALALVLVAPRAEAQVAPDAATSPIEITAEPLADAGPPVAPDAAADDGAAAPPPVAITAAPPAPPPSAPTAPAPSRAPSRVRWPAAPRPTEIEPPARPAAPLPFWTRLQGTAAVFEQSVTPETIAPSASLSPTPSYLWYFSLRPRIAVVPALLLGLRQDLAIELLNSSAYGSAPSPVTAGDLWSWARLRHRLAAADLELFAELRLLWPVSASSRTDGRVFTPALALGAERRFAFGRSGGALTLTPGARVLAPVRASSPAGYSSAVLHACVPLEEHLPQWCGAAQPGFTVAWSLALATRYTTPAPWLSFAAYAELIGTHGPPPPTVTIHDLGGGTITVTRRPEGSVVLSSMIALRADADITRWLRLSVGYYVVRAVLNADGSYGDPLWAPQSSRLFLTIVFTVDAPSLPTPVHP